MVSLTIHVILFLILIILPFFLSQDYNFLLHSVTWGLGVSKEGEKKDVQKGCSPESKKSTLHFGIARCIMRSELYVPSELRIHAIISILNSAKVK